MKPWPCLCMILANCWHFVVKPFWKYPENDMTGDGWNWVNKGNLQTTTRHEWMERKGNWYSRLQLHFITGNLWPFYPQTFCDFLTWFIMYKTLNYLHIVLNYGRHEYRIYRWRKQTPTWWRMWNISRTDGDDENDVVYLSFLYRNKIKQTA